MHRDAARGEQRMNLAMRCAIGGGVLLLLSAMGSTSASAYRNEEVRGGGTISGRIIMSGPIPPSKVFDLSQFPNARYCERGSIGPGKRFLDEVTALPDATLRDVVIYIKDVQAGKSFDFKGTEVVAKDCEFLVQGGPSAFVGVVANGASLRIVNQDADPDDPAAAEGVAHRPEAEVIGGPAPRPLFGETLSAKGEVLDQKVESVGTDEFIHLKCGIHPFMQAYFLPVENPYYDIVGQNGTYKIDRIPPGSYTVVAWHPVLGRAEYRVEVVGGQTLTLHFLFREGGEDRGVPGHVIPKDY
jgi:hypothetical protein